jgi:hypothetical protein
MKFRACLIMLSILALSLSNFSEKHVSAQEQKPSLAETVEWLKGKSEYISGISSDVTRETFKYAGYMRNADVWELASSHGCSLVWRSKKKPYYHYTRSSEIEMSVTVSLADLNPDRIEMSSEGLRFAHSQIFHRIRLFTTDRKKLVKWQFFIKETISDRNSLKAKITGNPSKKTKESTETFDANTFEIRVGQQMGQRFLNAIQHAISQCGGKVDKKEPF